MDPNASVLDVTAIVAPDGVVPATIPAAKFSDTWAGDQIAYRVVFAVVVNVPLITEPLGVVDQPKSVYPLFVIPVAPGRVTPEPSVVYDVCAPVGEPVAPFVL